MVKLLLRQLGRQCNENATAAAVAAAEQVDNEIAGLRRHGNACIGVVEADRVRRHSAFLQHRGKLAPYRCLLSSHALDSEEAHEAVGGGLSVDRHDLSLLTNGTCKHPSRHLVS